MTIPLHVQYDIYIYMVYSDGIIKMHYIYTTYNQYNAIILIVFFFTYVYDDMVMIGQLH